uniref:Immunoglobulin V-set domain-containing protein n=1 Tax=Xiphophorus maculatus TaxID=8083 RepID=A0A3B5RC59_XIPMA
MSQWHEAKQLFFFFYFSRSETVKIHFLPCWKYQQHPTFCSSCEYLAQSDSRASWKNNRTEFTIDTGTLKIINVTWNDSGLYVVERYDKNGKREADIKFNLQVQGKFTFLKSYFSASCCSFWNMFSFPIIF